MQDLPEDDKFLEAFLSVYVSLCCVGGVLVGVTQRRREEQVRCWGYRLDVAARMRLSALDALGVVF